MSLADKIAKEGKVIKQTIGGDEVLNDAELDELRDITVTCIRDEFGDLIEITHQDKTVNGMKIYMQPALQVRQVNYFVNALSHTEESIISKEIANCIIVRFKTTPRLNLRAFAIEFFTYGIIAVGIRYILSIINPEYNILI